MEHRVDIIRTVNDDPSVPPALHATCACGWAVESHDEGQLEQLVRTHERDEVLPVPASPTPTR